MSRYLTILCWIVLSSCRGVDSLAPLEKHTIHSEEIDDDFTIEFRVSENFDPSQPYTMIYIPDATLGLGTYVLGKDSLWSAQVPPQCVVAAIGHVGSTDMKRRRDFIPSNAGGHREKNFGNAHLFYEFLKSSIIPLVEKQFPKQKRKVLIGHSFSGLFCLYAALQNENLFDTYFAISPSVWANDRELLKIEEAFAEKNKSWNAKIVMYAGGLEVFNKVLSSTRSFLNNTQQRNYEGFSISLDVISAANHFSIRKPAIDRIFASLRN